MSPSDLYLINFQNPEPKFYGRIPHILDHLTYDEVNKKTGKIERRRLSIHAIQLYRVLKQTCGEGGACWKNRDYLAEQCNMSAGSVSKAKEELQKKFHQLDLNPLIKIEEKKRTNQKEGKITGGYIYHVITIINIWPWNNGYMATLKFNKKIEAETTCPSPNDEETTCPSPNDGQPPVCPSPGDTNKNNNNKNPLSLEEQSPATAGIVVFSEDKKRLFPSEDKKKIYDYLVKEGCHEATSYGIATTYSLDEFKKSLKYTNDSFAKNPKDNKWGYLHSVLKNKWWKSKNGK